MLFRHIGLFIFVALCTICGCNRKSFGMFDDSGRIPINRFDSLLFRWVDSDDSTDLQSLIYNYPQMLGLLGKTLFQTNEVDSSAFFNNLKNHYSQPALKSLYKDAITLYATDSPTTQQVEKEFSYGFMRLKEMFPSMQIPAIYMHVSGLRQSTIVADNLLSVSIDKYMGADYPLYEEPYYSYQRKNMTPACVAKDGLRAWLISEFPLQSKTPVLLEKMIYEGKIIYLLTQAGTDYSYPQIMQLTESEYKWCLKHEAALWNTLIERKSLDVSDERIISRYFLSAPSTFISEEAPGNLGNFIGYRIVARYMKRTKSTCESLMNSDAQTILQKSNYKP